MVKLAPHLVRPLPLVVPAFDGARPDRLVGVGLQPLRRDGRGGARRRGSDGELGARAPPHDRRRRGRRAAAGAGRPRARPRATSSTTARPTTPPRADRAGRGRALRRGLRQPRSRSPSWSRRAAARAASACATRSAASASACAPTTSSTRPACGPTGCAPSELHDEAEVPRIRPSRGTHITLAHDDAARSRAGAIVPAGGGRSIFALPWLGSTLIGTTDNDYDATTSTTSRPPRTTSSTCSTRPTPSSAAELGAGRHHRRLRRRAAADLHRRPEEVGRHLAQGRALRDLQRDDHHHRRQADDLAADGEDGRRPDRRARGARRAVPHARDPARPGGRRRATCRASRACPRTAYERLAGRYGHAAHDVLAVAARARRAGPADRARRAGRPARRGGLRGAPRAGPHASATRCCAAPASGCSRRAASPTPTGDDGAARGGGDGRRARVGRRAGAGRRHGLPRRGPRRRHRHHAVTFSTLAGWISATGPVDLRGALPVPMARRIALLAALARARPARRRRRRHAGALLRRHADRRSERRHPGARRPRRRARRHRRAGLRQARGRRRPRLRLAAASAAASSRPSGSTPAWPAPARSPSWRPSDGGRLVVAFVSGGGALHRRCARPARRAAPRPQQIAEGGANPRRRHVDQRRRATSPGRRSGDVLAARLERNAHDVQRRARRAGHRPGRDRRHGHRAAEGGGRRRRHRHRGVGRGRPCLRPADLRAAPVGRAAGPRRGRRRARHLQRGRLELRLGRLPPGRRRPSRGGSSARSSTRRCRSRAARRADAAARRDQRPRRRLRGRRRLGDARRLGAVAQGRPVQPGRVIGGGFGVAPVPVPAVAESGDGLVAFQQGDAAGGRTVARAPLRLRARVAGRHRRPAPTRRSPIPPLGPTDAARGLDAAADRAGDIAVAFVQGDGDAPADRRRPATTAPRAPSGPARPPSGASSRARR